MTLGFLDRALTHYSGSFLEADERPEALEAYHEVRESLAGAAFSSAGGAHAEFMNVALVPADLLQDLVHPIIYELVCTAVTHHINERGLSSIDFCDDKQEQWLVALNVLPYVADARHSDYSFGTLGYGTLLWLIQCSIETWCEGYRDTYEVAQQHADEDADD